MDTRRMINSKAMIYTKSGSTARELSYFFTTDATHYIPAEVKGAKLCVDNYDVFFIYHDLWIF